ncbi:MAG: AAA family ATPase [Spirochaetaceae bacterium]|nr:AAA family ATPase [Spirochaetaceae bacterium]
MDIREITAEVEREGSTLAQVRSELRKQIIGQDRLLGRVLIGLIPTAHLLIEGVPGLAKTLAVTTLAQAIRSSFRRIQFTPDLLPADLIGTLVYHPGSGEFTTKKGPIFANIVLADEINRAPAKVQSALLEAMQERQVTIGDATHPLDDPFMVLATQNPIEQEGTYPLPEAQVDRFMLKVVVGYPERDEELAIVRRVARTEPPQPVSGILEPADLARLRALADSIYLDEKVEEYVVDLVRATREPAALDLRIDGLDIGNLVEYGASPRATIYLTLAARAYALLQGRGFVTPQDVKTMAPDVLRHRVIATYEAEAEERTSDDLIALILDSLPVP